MDAIAHVMSLLELLRGVESRSAELVEECRKRSWLRRRWLYLAVGAATVAFGGYQLHKHRSEASAKWDKLIDSLHVFWEEHVIEPSVAIANELFKGSRLSSADQDAMIDAERSLQTMMQAYLGKAYPDMPRVEVEAHARRMNMEPISKRYEQEMTMPIRSAVMGDLVQLMLLQIQFIKKELLSAMVAIDTLLQENEMNLQMMATVPAFLAVFGAWRGLRNLYWRLTRPRSTGDLRTAIRLSLRDVDRLLNLANGSASATGGGGGSDDGGGSFDGDGSGGAGGGGGGVFPVPSPVSTPRGSVGGVPGSPGSGPAIGAVLRSRSRVRHERRESMARVLEIIGEASTDNEPSPDGAAAAAAAAGVAPLSGLSAPPQARPGATSRDTTTSVGSATAGASARGSAATGAGPASSASTTDTVIGPSSRWRSRTASSGLDSTGSLEDDPALAGTWWSRFAAAGGVPFDGLDNGELGMLTLLMERLCQLVVEYRTHIEEGSWMRLQEDLADLTNEDLTMEQRKATIYRMHRTYKFLSASEG